MRRFLLSFILGSISVSLVTFAQAQNGSMQMTMDGQTYTFKTDGKDYDGPFGSKMSWKAVDASTWEGTNKMGAKVLSTSRVSGYSSIFVVT